MGEHMKTYIMPNGKKYRFADGEVPAEAIPVPKAAAKQPNKAKKQPANKARKATKK